MQRSRKKVFEARDQDRGLDLAPIMSVLVLLIPVILITFTFFEVKVHAVSAPKMPGAETVHPQKKLRPTVFLERDHVRITASTLSQPIIVQHTSDGAYDYAKINEHVSALKKGATPEDRTIYVGAAPTVAWKHLARAIDAVRVIQTRKDAKPQPLFEQVVFVTE